MAAFQVFRSLPDQHLFSFPPTDAPAPIPPMAVPATVMRPFNIPDHIFTGALDPKVPLTIAALYAITIKSLNIYNKSTGKKPWAISKTRPFFAFVVLHNIFLAVYSAWTFVGMIGAMRRSIPNPTGPEGLAGTIDAFCRLHGPTGAGNSVYYNETSRAFNDASGTAALVDGLPSGAELGRIWNEGLAYYGWLFYISKFYEVLDTFIILAKGKLSSTLQTYHHAGAMLCMWAGMRYMSSPIWLFPFVNSFIHALMYTYYTLTAFGIKVPTGIKRTLTSMQITQFLFGVSYTMSHSFISYTVPIVTGSLATSADGAAEQPAAPSDSIIPTAAINALDSLKQLVFGADADAAAAAAASPNAAAAAAAATTETSYVAQPCIMTGGETFAIWINIVYLLPLTYLFVSFFIASYMKRSNATKKKTADGKHHMPSVEENVAMAEKAGWDAAKDIEKEVYGGERMLNSGSADEAAASSKESTPVKTRGKGKRRA